MEFYFINPMQTAALKFLSALYHYSNMPSISTGFFLNFLVNKLESWLQNNTSQDSHTTAVQMYHYNDFTSLIVSLWAYYICRMEIA